MSVHMFEAEASFDAAKTSSRPREGLKGVIDFLLEEDGTVGSNSSRSIVCAGLRVGPGLADGSAMSLEMSIGMTKWLSNWGVCVSATEPAGLATCDKGGTAKTVGVDVE
jgi:hypothetical protein